MKDKLNFSLINLESVDLFIIAGEHSGDEHAARLVKQLLQKNPKLKIAAIGGKELKLAGAHLLFDLTQHSVVGLIEVLKNYTFFKKLFNNIVEWIQINRPKTICLVDYPGLNLRLAKKLYDLKLIQKSGGDIRLVYYICPQIWAWKKNRRFDMAKTIDSLGVIFPFEVDCFKDTDLDVHFLGHPFVADDYKSNIAYNPNGTILLFPGSRKIPIMRIFPIMLETLQIYAKKHSNTIGTVVYPDNEILNLLQKILNQPKYQSISKNIEFKSNNERVEGKAVLTSSGTISLSSALAGIPGVLIYKANSITYWIGRYLVDINRLGMANILLGEDIYPEYIQHAADPKQLTIQLENSIKNTAIIERTHQLSDKLRMILRQKNNLEFDSWLKLNTK